MSIPLVAVTQRVVDMPQRNERRDVLDQAWAPFFAACGLDMIVIPNRIDDAAAYAARRGVTAVVLSGGNNISTSLGTAGGGLPRLPECDSDLAPERDVTETALLRASVERGWPVIGVCRGMQVLNVFHGGSLARVEGHAGRRHRLASVAARVFDPEVNSFHDFGVSPELKAPDLEVLATAEGWPEAIEHPRLRHLGIMWHPERNRPTSLNDVALFRDYLTGRPTQL